VLLFFFPVLGGRTTSSLPCLCVSVDFCEFVAILSRYWLHLVAMLTIVEFFLVLLDKVLVRRPELLISRRH
jgi:hypothetical protein